MKVFGRCVFVHGIALFVSVLLISTASSRSASATQLQSSVPAGKGEFDGPAELPREHVASSLSATPAPGKTVTVHAGDDLSQALALPPAVTPFNCRPAPRSRAIFVRPDKHCDDAHWIILRTSAADSKLPPEGTRLTPCYAGVSSLPGRPAFKCASTENVMAKVESDNKGGPGLSRFPRAPATIASSVWK